jgi:F-type H+-transporting ATPase subunit a
MSATRRGFIIFGGLVVVTAIFCIWLPFFGLPRAGLGVGLPSISLPAEVLIPNIPVLGIPLTNSMTSMIGVDIILLLIGVTINRVLASQSIDRFVPRGLTNGIELIVEFWYNQARNVLGEHTRKVVPLALTVFFFLLFSNWSSLIPGFETVGLMTCAEAGKSGYPLMSDGSFLLRVDSLDLKRRAPTKVTEADQEACEAAHPANIAPRVPSTPPPQTGTTTATTSTAATETTPNPNLFQVVPFFRALATDLNMPLALAVIVFMAVQIWGIGALGLPYFYKFINIPALGNLAKNPIGVMDFVVGLVDIISELSRLISLSFRLLGNVFAGGVLLAVMTFLVAGVLPVAFYGLELFAGLIQAYVFGILTVMYASQAVFAHHAEDHDEPAHSDAPNAHGASAPAMEQVVDLG